MKLLKLIKERRTNRHPYNPRRRISKQDLGYILEAARWAPTPHNMQNFEIVVVDDKNILEAIGNIKFAVSNSFIKENYGNLSFSKEELIRKKTGLLANSFPPAMRTLGAKLDEAFYGERRASIRQRIQSSSALVLLIYDPKRRAPASQGNFLGIIGLGCILENMWLMAHSLGMSLQIMSMLSMYPEIEGEVKRILNIPEELKIGFVFRLGYSLPRNTKYFTVRREVGDFTHYNRFGSFWLAKT